MDEPPRHADLAESSDSESETPLGIEVVRLAVLTGGVVLLLFVLFALAWDPSLLHGAGAGGGP